MNTTTRPYCTLFLLESLDGKISTGDTDQRDFDKDLATISGIGEGLPQYYEIEQQTDLVSFNTGRVLAKVGTNERPLAEAQKTSVSFVVVDNKPHLTVQGVEFMAVKSDKLYVITTNKNHPAYELQQRYDNLTVLGYNNKVDFTDAFTKMREQYNVERMTIQTGGELNATLLRAGLIDRVLCIVAPCLVGGRATSSLVDGESLRSQEDLAQIRPLVLRKCEALEKSYVRLEYDVMN